jgi:hypothetical protein
MILRSVIFFLFLTVCCCRAQTAPDSSMKFDEAKWEDVVKDKDYTETYEEEEKKEDRKKDFGDIKTPSMNLGGLRYVFYFLVVAGILFLIAKILQNMSNAPVLGTGDGKTYTLEEVEEKMMEIDLDAILKQAVLSKDFRLALRINFLIIIKALTLSGKITWAREKTNWEYLNEIRDMLVAHKFKIIVVSFESIWYGEHSVSEEQFNTLQASYHLFKNGISK